MDTTEVTEPIIPDYPLPPLVIGQEGKDYLYTAGKWAKFLGILGFIVTGLLALVAVFAGTVSSIMGALSSSPSGFRFGAGMGALSMLPLIPIIILYFFVSYYLYQFGANVKNGVAINDTMLVTKALRNLKSHFKLMGVIAIIVIVIYALVFIFGALVFGTFMHH